MAKIQTHKITLGIDAGGTHTRFVLMDENGQIIHQEKSASIHFMKVGYEGITKALKDFKDGCEYKDYNVAIGMAGYGEDASIRNHIEDAVFKVYPSALILNDAQFAHIAALEGQDGVYVISGTGSIAFNKVNNQFMRSGGFGYLLDDGGSAFWIGKKILEHFVKMIDGRSEKTKVYDTLIKHFNISNPYEIINIIFDQKENYRNYVANISILLSDIEDDTLTDIYHQAGLELAHLANAFKPKKTTTLSYGGGVLLNNKSVLKSFTANLNPHFDVISPKHPVEYAAYILHKK